MISQSPQDRQFYEARLRYLESEEARLTAAYKAAREEGAAQGTLIAATDSDGCIPLQHARLAIIWNCRRKPR